MRRYCKQRNRFSCGPVAILNAMKWQGQNVTYKSHYDTLYNETKCDKDGVDRQPFADVLDKYCGEIVYGRPTLKIIRHALDHDWLCVILESWLTKKKKELHGHYYLITGYDNSCFHVINHSRTYAIQRRIPRVISEGIKYRVDDVGQDYPVMWIVKP